jgi:hypothetical protein
VKCPDPVHEVIGGGGHYKPTCIGHISLYFKKFLADKGNPEINKHP